MEGKKSGKFDVTGAGRSRGGGGVGGAKRLREGRVGEH